MGGSDRWMARGASGFVFLVRTKPELEALGIRAVRDRLRAVKAAMDPKSGGMAWDRAPVRRLAMRERRQLEGALSAHVDRIFAEVDQAMRINELFPSKYIKADDLAIEGVAGRWRTATVKIRDVVLADIGDEQKAVAYFKGKEKGLVINRTIADELEALSGSDDTDDWVGLVVELYVDPSVKFQGKRTPGIRVRKVTATDGREPAPRVAEARGEPPASLAGTVRELPAVPVRRVPVERDGDPDPAIGGPYDDDIPF